MALTHEHVARICHEANRAYCLALGDATQLSWDLAPEWQKQSAIAGIAAALKPGASPETLHEEWVKAKTADGWAYAPEKVPEAKTHPGLVPYARLTEAEKGKDALFFAIVRAMLPATEVVVNATTETKAPPAAMDAELTPMPGKKRK